LEKFLQATLSRVRVIPDELHVDRRREQLKDFQAGHRFEPFSSTADIVVVVNN
jgi:hypothetical protein